MVKQGYYLGFMFFVKCPVKPNDRNRWVFYFAFLKRIFIFATMKRGNNKKLDEPRKILGACVSIETKEAVRDIAIRKNISMSSVAGEMIETYLKGETNGD